MRPPKNSAPFTIIRPSVVASIVYFGLCSVWAIYTLSTVKVPTIEPTEPWRILSTSQYLGASVVNILFASVFLIDARATLRGPVEARRAHLTGLAFAAVILVLVQIGAHQAYGPITVGQSLELSPAEAGARLGIHWMTEEELERFDFFTDEKPDLK